MSCISCSITVGIHVMCGNHVFYNWINELFAVSIWNILYKHLHGLIFDTSIWLPAGSTRFSIFKSIHIHPSICKFQFRVECDFFSPRKNVMGLIAKHCHNIRKCARTASACKRYLLCIRWRALFRFVWTTMCKIQISCVMLPRARIHRMLTMYTTTFLVLTLKYLRFCFKHCVHKAIKSGYNSPMRHATTTMHWQFIT